MVPFDELLDASAPPVAVPSAASDHAIRILRDASRRRGWRTGWIVGGAFGLALLTGGAAVAASTGLLDQVPWVPDIVASPGDGGQPCENAWRIDAPVGVPEDAPYLVEARRILGELDLATLDTSGAYRQVVHQYEVDGIHDSEGEPVRLSDEEYRAEALSIAIREELERELRAGGFGDELDTTGYLIQGATLCDEDAS